MGGTFDPIHIGHLAVAQECLEYKKLNKILFIPTGHPNFKIGKKITPGDHRQKMVELAIASNPKFFLCDYELKKPTPSYSYETIQYLKNQEDAEYYFIMGEDSLLEIDRWHQSEFFQKAVHVLVCRRSPDTRVEIDHKILEMRKKGTSVEKVPFTFLDISSTDIRQKFFKEKNPQYYLPESVYQYIMKERLY